MRSPAIDRVEMVRHGKVRRAKLYYLRALRGKLIVLLGQTDPIGGPLHRGVHRRRALDASPRIRQDSQKSVSKPPLACHTPCLRWWDPTGPGGTRQGRHACDGQRSECQQYRSARYHHHRLISRFSLTKIQHEVRG